MGKLTAAGRKSIPSEDFAGPGRSFPVEDKGHAEAALEDAPIAEEHGSITASERDLIDRKAHAKLDKHPTRIAIRKAGEAVRGRG